jgi:hypothetical protein
MRVEKLRPPALGGAARRAEGAAGFGALLDAAGAGDTGPGHEASETQEAGALQQAAAAALAAPIGAMLGYDSAMQAVAADRQARRHGRAMLRALGALQLTMLGAEGDSAGQQLAALAADMPAADDPVLRLILREIGVRAAVALARAGTNTNVSIG